MLLVKKLGEGRRRGEERRQGKREEGKRCEGRRKGKRSGKREREIKIRKSR